MDLPNRGNILAIPLDLHKTDDGRIGGTAQFRRFHLGRNGAAHGGAVALLFDSAAGIRGVQAQRQPRPAHRVSARRLPQDRAVEKELQVDAGIDSIDDRKIFVSGRLLDGDAVLAEAARAVREAAAGTAVKQDEEERPSIARADGPGGATGYANGRKADSSTASRSQSSDWRSSPSASSRSRIRARAGQSCLSGSAFWRPSSTGRDGCWPTPRSATTRSWTGSRRQDIGVQVLGGVFTALIVVGHTVAARRG